MDEEGKGLSSSLQYNMRGEQGSQGFQKEVHAQNYGERKGDRDRGEIKGDNNFYGMCGNKKSARMLSGLGRVTVKKVPCQAWEGPCGENPGNLGATGQHETGQGIIWGSEGEQERYGLQSSGHTWGQTPWPCAWLCSTPPLQLRHR